MVCHSITDMIFLSSLETKLSNIAQVLILLFTFEIVISKLRKDQSEWKKEKRENLTHSTPGTLINCYLPLSVKRQKSFTMNVLNIYT